MSVTIGQIRTLFQRGELEQARTLGETTKQESPPSADLFDLMGMIYASLGQLDTAFHQMSEALELAPENPKIIAHMADISAMKGDLKSSIKLYRRSLALCTPNESIGKAFAFPNLSFRGDEFSYLNPSFSIGGEDLILRKLFKDKLRSQTPGYYVDIGAASTVLGSNTYLFYCYGWNGICIDANPATGKAFSIARPRDTYLNCAVGPSNDEVFFGHHKGENAGMSKVDKDAEAFGSDFLKPIKIQCRRLSDILDELAPSGVSIDLMSIDVEGGEIGVISSNDWSRFRPRIIVLEDTTFFLNDPKSSDAVDTLINCDYSVIGWMAPNVFLECKD